MIASRTLSILAVHQGFELYGSDRTFVSSLLAMSEIPNSRVVAVIPKRGTLYDHLMSKGIDVRVEDIFIPRKANGIIRTALSVLKIPLYFFINIRRANEFDVLYINTSIVLTYIIASRFSSARSFVHVHEIPSPQVRKLIGAIIRFAKPEVIFNSEATKNAFALNKNTLSHVVLNGVPDNSLIASREPLSDPESIRLLIIGRLSHSKGQDLLLEAVSLLQSKLDRNIHVKFAGTAFQDRNAQASLEHVAESLKIHGKIEFVGFVDDPATLYDWADLVIVPSRTPESFGLVAVEAMRHSRPVIAAAQGGILEIVVDGVTGATFLPNDALDLAATIEHACRSTESAVNWGEAGRKRFSELFSETRYRSDIARILGA